jgi:hypothetical protein
VDLAIEAVLRDRDVHFPWGYAKRVRGVKRAEVRDALAKYTSARDVSIVAVGDASVLEPQFAQLPGVREVEVVDVDAA